MSACACRQRCGDVPEREDSPQAVCKALVQPPVSRLRADRPVKAWLSPSGGFGGIYPAGGGVSVRTREIEKCDKRLTWLAESLDGVVPWPTEPEVNEWHFEPNEVEFVALATPKRIAALAAAAAREQKLREALRDAEALCARGPACGAILRAALAASPASEEPA